MTSTNFFASNKDLINYLKECGSIKSDFVFEIMCSVDRKHFMNNSSASYTDRPQLVAYGKTTSAPHMHARVLEYLSDKLRNAGRVLDIGSGSGYLTTCMSLALRKSGVVIGMDCIPGFQAMANKIIKKYYPKLLTGNRIQFIVGDGRQGFLACSPYNIIHVGLAATHVPEILLDQLAPGGSLIMPIGDKNHQTLCLYNKSLTGVVEKRELLQVRYGNFDDVKDSDLLNFENTIENEKSSTVSYETLSNYIENFKKVVEHSFKIVEKKIVDFETVMSGKIDSVVSMLNGKYEETGEKIFQRINDVEENHNKLNSDLYVLKKEVQIELKNYYGQMAGKIEVIEQKINTILDEFQKSKNISEQKEKHIYLDKLADIEKIYNEFFKLSEVQKSEIEKGNIKWNEINQQLQNVLDKWNKIYVKSVEERLSTSKILEKSNFQIDDHDAYENLEKKWSMLNEELIKQNEKIDIHEKILEEQIKFYKKKETSKIAERKKLEMQQNLIELTEAINQLNKEIKITELENEIRRFTLETGKDASVDSSTKGYI